MAEERKLQIPVEVDATGAKQGFSEVKAAAQDMGQAVSQAGTTAAKGVDGIAEAAGKFTREQSRLYESIKRTATITATARRRPRSRTPSRLLPRAARSFLLGWNRIPGRSALAGQR